MNRIFHTWDKWECFPAGFWNNKKEGLTKQECEEKYRELLSDCDLFASILENIIKEWKYSCEHNLSNESMNRIAWLGQASLSYHLGIPSCYRSGYNKLTDQQKIDADATAMIYLNKWLTSMGEDELNSESAKSKTPMNKY